MNSLIAKINFYLLRIGLLLANILWIKALVDINTYAYKRPYFHFPKFFKPLFISGAIVLFIFTGYIFYSFQKSKSIDQKITPSFSFLFWILIPIASLCNSLVEYNEKISIFVSYFPFSTVLRTIYFIGKKDIAIFILLCLCFLIIIPNNRCFNPFNHWWLDKIGASPLVYLPTMIVILFVVSGLNGLNKYLSTTSVGMLIIASLFISLSHITRFLW
jgi:hypothetical protein